MPEQHGVGRLSESRSSEALPGGRTFAEVEALLRDELREQFCTDDSWTYVWLRDLTDEWVAYEVDCEDGCETYRVDYSIDDAGVVTFTSVPVEVEVRTIYNPEPPEPDMVGMLQTSEAIRPDRIAGRVLESSGADDLGGRIFRVQIIEHGLSKNQRRYPESVITSSAALYEGAKAFDHHRTDSELQTSTIGGLVGQYRNVTPNGRGLEADLHLLPSATHTAEALDASLAAQAAGLEPLVGISHDVVATYRTVAEGSSRVQEATQIVRVLSADVVADPAAGGKAIRMVAGGLSADGTTPTPSPQEDTSMNFKQLMAALRSATAEDRAALLVEHAAVLVSSGFSANDVPTLLGEDSAPVEVAEPELVGATESHARESITGRMLIRESVAQAGLDTAKFVPIITKELGERVTEAEIVATVDRYIHTLEGLELDGLAPKVRHVDVKVEDLDQKAEKLYQSMIGNYREGYSSLRQAFADITDMSRVDLIDGDLPRMILRESYLGASRDGERLSESVNASSWSKVLGDSVTRALIDAYNTPDYQTWRRISRVVPVQDFRVQRRDRLAGYGNMPTVTEGSPYQPITSPTDEEATYSISKKGATEDLTLEAIANDDLGAVVRIPKNLGISQARTLYRAVFNLLVGNGNTTYDSTALFAAGHGSNTAASAMSDAALTAGRVAMAKQTAYAVSQEVLGITPRFLIYAPDLLAIAQQLTESAVAIPSGSNASNIPNVQQGLERIMLVTDLATTSATQWYLAADPSVVPTIEVGFYKGIDTPELFVQDDPTVGSNFNADKITWKSRLTYGTAVLDHRGFYRGNS